MGEEDQEVLKHTCKLCNKSFPCGRSLGGHMRSHVINSAEHDHHHQPKLHKKKLSTLINNGGSEAKTKATDFIDTTAYGLRENPKKTGKFKDLSHENTLLHDKVCKQCGKGFLSWKALFGHMKCHSDKVSTNNNSSAAAATTLEGDSWASANQKLVLDKESDNENLGRNRKKRSSRRGGIKRYMATTDATTTNNTNTTASSSLSISINANANNNNNHINNNNVSTSVSGIEHENEQEQEEIAMCLMMLSRDVSQRGGLTSDSYSAFVEADLVKFSTMIEGENSVCNGGEVVKIKRLRNGKLESTVLAFEDLKSKEFGASEVARIESKKSGDFLGKPKVEKKNLIKKSETDHQDGNFISRKRKGTLNLLDPELGMNYSQEMFNNKETDPNKSKYECTTCNKAFHSYQALGGHMASHKKLKGGYENSVGPTEAIDQEMIFTSFAEKAAEKNSFAAKKISAKGVGGTHECPICFRVFSSGQALGGHKRSHLLAEARLISQSTNSIVIEEEPIRETRDFFDLNMPAPVEEEVSTISNAIDQFKPWWVESNHLNEHESFLSLLSS